MRISASLAWSDWTSKASQPNTRSTARYANRSVTGTDSARARGARAARQLTQSSQETQASGYDRILGTHTARPSRPGQRRAWDRRIPQTGQVQAESHCASLQAAPQSGKLPGRALGGRPGRLRDHTSATVLARGLAAGCGDRQLVSDLDPPLTRRGCRIGRTGHPGAGRAGHLRGLPGLPTRSRMPVSGEPAVISARRARRDTKAVPAGLHPQRDGAGTGHRHPGRRPA